MDDKTAELRNIFMDVSEEGTVTERQEESPGTLAADDVDDRLAGVIAQMRDRYGFTVDLTDDELATIATGFYADRDDETIATDLGITPDVVRRARLDLHLLTDADRDTPFDFEAFRRAHVQDDPEPPIPAADEAELDRYRAIVAAETEMRRANYRFRDQFDELLGDGDVAPHLTRDVTDDGLADATEGIEIDTGF